MQAKTIKRIGIAVVLIALIALPAFLSKYLMYLVIIGGINAILAVSLRFINLFGGWSFVHIPLMGMGGYMTALLTTTIGNIPFWLSIPISSLLVMLVALILSYPLLQTGGFYFFLASYAAGEMLRQIWIVNKDVFGGYNGLAGMSAPEGFLGINFSSYNSMWYLVLIFVLGTIAVLYWLEKTLVGVSARSISSNEQLSKSIGMNTSAYKRATFVIGSFFAGMAGVLYAHFLGYVSPLDYTSDYAYQIMAMVIIGGASSFAGPLVGVVLLTAVREMMHELLTYVPLVYGIFLILTLYFLPEGIISIPRRVLKKMHSRRDSKGQGGG